MANQMKNKKLVFLQTLFCCFLFVQLNAQPQNASFRNLTSAQGLPTTSVTHVAQDAFGFIWIGSWVGAYRYDSRSFKKISEHGRYVNADKNGGMWITQEYSVAFYNPYSDSLREYEIPNAIRYGHLNTDNGGGVWVSTIDGIVKFDSQKNIFVKDDRQRSGVAIKLNATGNGVLVFHFIDKNNQQQYIGKRDSKGHYDYEPYPLDLNRPEKGKYFNDAAQLFILLTDSTGIIIINEYGWAYKSITDSKWIFKKLPNNEDIPQTGEIKADTLGNFWINHLNSLTRINIVSGNKITYAHDPRNPNSILPLKSIFMGCEMFFDRQGVLWVPLFSQGISRLNLFESDFGLLRDADGLPINDVLSAHESKDGSFWIGSRISNDGLLHFGADGKIIKRYGSKSFESPPGKTVSKDLSHPYPWAIAESRDGSIWVGGGSPAPRQGGVNRIRPGTDLITRLKNDPYDVSSINGDWITNIKIDGNDRVWLFPTSGGMCFIDPATDKVTRWKKDPSSGSTDSTSYYPELVTNSGDLIIGTEGYKNYIINHKTLIKEPFGVTSDQADKLRYVHQDDKGKIWFISKKGFGYLDPSFTVIPYYYEFDKKGTYAYEISGLNSDKEGKIWLSTTNGILQFDPATEKFKHFGFERGLQGNYFERLNYKGPSDKIYFGGNGGVNIFDPALIKTNSYPPEMIFIGLKLDGKPITYSKKSAIQKPIFVADKITVGPDVLTVSIDFAAIHFAGENSNQHQYKLEGFDKDWRDGGNSGNATYTNLSPGKYTLYIGGSNWDNVWSDGKKSIDIIILPPWWRTNTAYAFYILALIALLFGINKIQRKRVIAKERERTRDKELAQAKEIEKAYNELKSTQAQLIQSEKMASLGELTAGIAHEIQNPLNFVNNFSELSNELVEEMNDELSKGDIEEAKAIAGDIKQNLEKINHHGRRADAIVKGMLQHSRTSTGQKEPTDINKLADEYLRLSYHGMRAKDKSFNAEIKTEFDESIGKINIVPQDIGRVLLNLFNNAFYACTERSRSAVMQKNASTSSEGQSYEPTVSVSTKKLDSKIEIHVKDNGVGIPQKVVDKIFQPFFTTKPTGQGTGLGLSLSYDIIKAHGGEIKVKTREDEGAEFIIQLPI
jgi:signal transduction histidine kinase/ligand-binding sensor domain-containing protein